MPSLTAQRTSVNYNERTGLIESTVEKAQELANIVKERDALVLRNMSLEQKIDSLKAINTAMSNDVRKLTDEILLQNQIQRDASNDINNINDRQDRFINRLGKGLHMDIATFTNETHLEKFYITANVRLQFGKWKVFAQPILGNQLPLTYNLGVGYNLF